MRSAPPRRASGFTLVEAVLVIMLTGVVAVMAGTFIKAPVTSYADQARRAELGDAADLALRRIAREVRGALPNSVRVDATNTVLEFLPVSAGGRYRSAPDSGGAGDDLDFSSSTDGSFDVLGPGVPVANGDQLVIYNLGLPGADAYSGENRRALSGAGSGLTRLTFVPNGTPFPFASPSSRFQIVSTPVTFACTPGSGGSGRVRRYGGYAIQATQPANVGASPLSALTGSNNALLIDKVESCSFVYNAGNGARNGLLTLAFKLTSGGESVNLMHQVQVDNSP